MGSYKYLARRICVDVDSSIMSSITPSEAVISSLRGKVLQKPDRKVSHVDLEGSDWTPYNSNLQLHGIKVLVDAPCPDVKKENAFEDTMFLIDILRQTKEKENMIRNLALEQKRRMQKK